MPGTEEDTAYSGWLKQAKIEKQDNLAYYDSDAKGLKEPPERKIPASWIARAIRESRLTGHEIFSGLRMRDATIEGDLRLESYDIAFPLHFIDCWFTGKVHLWQAKTRSLIFRGCRLAKGADLTSAKVDGHLILRGFSSDGPIIARDMRIEGQLDMSGASLLYRRSEKPEEDMERFGLTARTLGECFGFSRSHASALYWRYFATKPQDRVTLRDAQVGTFMHDLPNGLDSWPPCCLGPAEPEPELRLLAIDGFHYDRIAHEEKKSFTVERAKEWLKLGDRFSDDAYITMARAYKKNSQIDEAEDVLAALKEREVDRMKFSGRKIFYRAVYWTIGYGKRSAFALVLLAALFASSVVAAYILKDMGYIQPAVGQFLLEPCSYYKQPPNCDKSKLEWWHPVQLPPGMQARYVPEPYPPFSSLAYALESFVPAFDFDQRKYWEPTNFAFRALFALLSTLGIFLGGVFVGSITGFLTPRVSDL